MKNIHIIFCSVHVYNDSEKLNHLLIIFFHIGTRLFISFIKYWQAANASFRWQEITSTQSEASLTLTIPMR